MKVKELINKLKGMPQDADVWQLWHGDARSEIKLVWLSRDGRVMASDTNEICQTDEVRPAGALGIEEVELLSVTELKIEDN
jgi:hypothetical protein